MFYVHPLKTHVVLRVLHLQPVMRTVARAPLATVEMAMLVALNVMYCVFYNTSVRAKRSFLSYILSPLFSDNKTHC